VEMLLSWLRNSSRVGSGEHGGGRIEGAGCSGRVYESKPERAIADFNAASLKETDVGKSV
jgi:hypothetical protein